MQLPPNDMPPAIREENKTLATAIYFRLIALWVLCEAMLGGIIHGFKIPVSGLVVGSCAVICICLIGWYAPGRGAIIRATLIVAIFKMMLSPQAPPTAYIAVFFQGLLGELLFTNKKYYKAACITLAILALLESATQRILVMTLVYGKDLWKVLNDSIYKIGGDTDTNYSYFIIVWYILIHLLTGTLVGIWAAFLPQRIQLLDGLQKKYQVQPEDNYAPLIPRQKQKTAFFRRFFFISWIFLLLLWLQSVLRIGQPLLPAHISLRLLLRSLLIILTWYFLVAPLLKKALQQWLQQKKKQSASQVQAIVEQLPLTRNLVAQSWELSAGKKGLARLRLCCRIILANTFHNATG